MKRAFTLIELLVVIGIMAVIAAGVIATLNPRQKMLQAQDAQTQSGVGQVATALQAAAAVNANGNYPVALANLVPDELSALPALPVGINYTYAGGGTGVVSVSAPMQAARNLPPNTAGNLWCWRSAAGSAVFANACAP